jgi:hypothetical protein
LDRCLAAEIHHRSCPVEYHQIKMVAQCHVLEAYSSGFAVRN